MTSPVRQNSGLKAQIAHHVTLGVHRKQLILTSLLLSLSNVYQLYSFKQRKTVVENCTGLGNWSTLSGRLMIRC